MWGIPAGCRGATGDACLRARSWLWAVAQKMGDRKDGASTAPTGREGGGKHRPLGVRLPRTNERVYKLDGRLLLRAAFVRQTAALIRLAETSPVQCTSPGSP